MLDRLQVNCPLDVIHHWKPLLMLLLRDVMCLFNTTNGYGENPTYLFQCLKLIVQKFSDLRLEILCWIDNM